MIDNDFIIPFKVMVDRFETKKNKQGEEYLARTRCNERYADKETAMDVFNNTEHFCMVTHRKENGSKILAYRYERAKH